MGAMRTRGRPIKNNMLMLHVAKKIGPLIELNGRKRFMSINL